MASTRNKPVKKTAAKPKAATKDTAKGRAPRRRRAPTPEAIAERAYELHLARGDGDHVAHWLQAERELSAS
jgi:hypothetical protein